MALNKKVIMRPEAHTQIIRILKLLWIAIIRFLRQLELSWIPSHCSCSDCYFAAIAINKKHQSSTQSCAVLLLKIFRHRWLWAWKQPLRNRQCILKNSIAWTQVLRVLFSAFVSSRVCLLSTMLCQRVKIRLRSRCYTWLSLWERVFSLTCFRHLYNMFGRHRSNFLFHKPIL